jgi:hypothetical protein
VNRATSLVAMLLCTCSLCMSQAAKPILTSDLDKFLAQGCPEKLTKCTVRLQEWQAMWDTYKPFCEQMKTENETLRRNADSVPETRLRIFLAFGAVGFGTFLAFLVSRGVSRAWPLSFEHKQLAMLVMVAAWVSVAALIAVSDSRFSYHPLSSALRVGLWSLPALVFGAVSFWWFGKRQRA